MKSSVFFPSPPKYFLLKMRRELSGNEFFIDGQKYPGQYGTLLIYLFFFTLPLFFLLQENFFKLPWLTRKLLQVAFLLLLLLLFLIYLFIFIYFFKAWVTPHVVKGDSFIPTSLFFPLPMLQLVPNKALKCFFLIKGQTKISETL